MDGITLKIRGTLKGPFEEVAAQMPRIEKRALYRAAYFLREKIQNQLISSLPASTKRNPKYSDTLVDAVQFTRVDGASLVVNAMGNRKPKSGTFRARFFEEGTVERFHKKRNGIRLKRKKSVGHIKPYKFFSSAVSANENAAIQIMRDTISEYVEETFKNTQ